MKKVIFGISVLMLASLACQAISLPGSLSGSGDSQALFQDDFSGSPSNWATGDDGSAVLAIENGFFRLSIGAPQQLYWSTPGKNFSDVRIEVDADKVSGPDVAEYGLICRYNEDGDNYNFYYLVIAGDTYAAIIKVVNSEQVEVSARDVQFNAIHGGNASNHIVAECVGNRLSLYANGTELFTVADDSHTTGDVGLIATTYEEGGMEVHFDNFVVTEP
jgi:hypothetical protein